MDSFQNINKNDIGKWMKAYEIRKCCCKMYADMTEGW